MFAHQITLRSALALIERVVSRKTSRNPIAVCEGPKQLNDFPICFASAGAISGNRGFGTISHCHESVATMNVVIFKVASVAPESRTSSNRFIKPLLETCRAPRSDVTITIFPVECAKKAIECSPVLLV